MTSLPRGGCQILLLGDRGRRYVWNGMVDCSVAGGVQTTETKQRVDYVT